MSPRFTLLRAPLAIALWACAWSCGRAAAPPEHANAGRAEPARLSAIGPSLEAQGFAPAPWITGDLSAGKRLTLSLPAQGDSRVAAVAIGEPEALSLDIRVRDAASRDEVASDVSRGRRAAASFTARRGEMYEVTAVATSGSGRATLALFEAPLSTPPPRLPGLFDSDPGARLAWPSIVAALAADGYSPSGEPTVLEVDEATRRAFTFSLEAGRCYYVVALGSPGVDSLELRLFDGDELLSGDLAQRYSAWTATCPERDLDARASLSSVAGTGTARLGLFSAPYEAVASRVGPRLRVPPRDRTAESELRRRGALLSRLGYGAPEIVAAFRDLEAGGRRPIPLPPDLEGCYALVAAAEGPRAEIDLGLALEGAGAGGGATSLHDASEGAGAQIGVCHGRGVHPAATLIALRETGSAIVALHRLAGPAVALGDVEIDLTFREAAARFRREGLGEVLARAELAPCAQGFCASLHLDGGRCYGAVALARGGRVARLEATPEGAAGGRAPIPGGPGVSELAWCPASDADYEFAATTAGAGAPAPSLAVFTEAEVRR